MADYTFESHKLARQDLVISHHIDINVSLMSLFQSTSPIFTKFSKLIRAAIKF